jgi:AcrR family transcriptional regulator
MAVVTGSITMNDLSALETVQRRPGRPRDESARQRILDAALELLQEESFPQVTVESIASRAGVGKATVYRWWPNKAAVMIEAFREAVGPEVPFPDSGCLEDDIRLQMQKFTRMLLGPRGRMLAGFVAAAQSDADMAAALSDSWIKPRRAEAKEALRRKRRWKEFHTDLDPELVLDILYAPLYYRVMTGLPLTIEYTESLVDLVMKALSRKA